MILRRKAKIISYILLLTMIFSIFFGEGKLFSFTAFGALENSGTTISLEASSEENSSDENGENEESENSEEASTDDDSNVVSGKFAFPNNMKAVNVRPGEDFFTDPSQSDETTLEEINEILSELNSLQMNTIVIDINYQDIAYYSLEPGLTVKENALKMLINEAKEQLFFVYINFNMNSILGDYTGTSLSEKVNYLTQIAYRFASQYFIDAIILDGYYSQKSNENFGYYMNSGSGIGFDQWLLENGGYVFSVVANSIRKTDSSIPVGISINDVWANSETDIAGSLTNGDFEALTDGYSDTVSYIDKGYADFIFLKTDGSIDDPDLPFETVTKWWSDIASMNTIPLFISHANEHLSTSKAGWGADDQLLHQLIYARDNLLNYQGSGYNTYSDLINGGLATDNLVKFYNDEINEDALLDELEILSPSRTNFTTTEPALIFQGTFDENFDVTLNGEPVELNEAGNFYNTYELEPGRNLFVFESKGKQVVYDITRDIQVIKSYQPQSDMRVEGKTIITISVEAYEGSDVYATINGSTITLSPSESSSGVESGNSSYVTYSGTYTTPAGKEGKDQNLGYVQITGSYKDIKTENAQGGQIIVNALPVQNTGTGMIRINNDNTETYDYYTSQTYTVPTCTRLPGGTIDYATRIVTYEHSSNEKRQYYLTESGKRVLTSDATLISQTNDLNYSSINLAETYMDNGDTVVKFDVSNKIPFTMSFGPTEYYNGYLGKFYVDNFSATQIYIDFDYISEATGSLVAPSGSIFSSSSWTTANGKQRLVLNLNQAGIYSGVTITYDSNGDLLFKFNDYNSGIAGSVILVDPGHGVAANGAFDSGSFGYVNEYEVNINVAKMLTAELESRGATVIMLPTNTTYYNTYLRADLGIGYHIDMYLSIHSDGFIDSSGSGEGYQGSSVYYFNAFSQPLAEDINYSMAQMWKNDIYKDGKDRNRGDLWNWFAVTLLQDFPSVLIELGFVTDSVEGIHLSKSSTQQLLAEAIADGVAAYFARK